jgi:hypothetical protein
MLLLGCAEAKKPVPVATRAAESLSAESRWEAVVEALAGAHFKPERLLVDMMRFDPSPQNRLGATELLQSKAVRKDALVNFLGSAFFDPDLRVRIAAARGLAGTPQEGGLLKVVTMAVGTLHEVDAGVDGYPLKLVAAEHPRESMATLVTHFAGLQVDGLGEAAVELAGALIEAEPALRSEPEVRSWLEAYRVGGSTERARSLAAALLDHVGAR